MIYSQSLVVELLGCSPLAAATLIDLHVECIGCSMNKFCSLEDMCRHYELDLSHFLTLIQEKVGEITFEPSISTHYIEKT